MEEKKSSVNSTAAEADIRDSILDNLNITIYVSDLATNEILYANRALQLKHNGQPLAGKVCWEALENKTNRCESCSIPYLLKHPGKSYQQEINNGWYLKIYDSIIPWKNGKLVHLRYVVDITDSVKRE